MWLELESGFFHTCWFYTCLSLSLLVFMTSEYLFCITGGSEINPSHLTESFDMGLSENLWEFHPYGQVQNGVCLNGDSALYWSNQRYNQRDNFVITRQLIIDRNYMLQFKVNLNG